MSDTVIMGVDTQVLDEDLHDVQLFIAGREFDLGDLSSQDDMSLRDALIESRSKLLRELEDPRQFAYDESIAEFSRRTSKQVSVLNWLISRVVISGASCVIHIPA